MSICAYERYWEELEYICSQTVLGKCEHAAACAVRLSKNLIGHSHNSCGIGAWHATMIEAVRGNYFDNAASGYVCTSRVKIQK